MTLGSPLINVSLPMLKSNINTGAVPIFSLAIYAVALLSCIGCSDKLEERQDSLKTEASRINKKDRIANSANGTGAISNINAAAKTSPDSAWVERSGQTLNDKQKLYTDVKILYDRNEYDKCIDKSSKIIRVQGKPLLESKNYVLLANLYELQADCLERKGDIYQSVEINQILLLKLEELLPKDYVARVKLKIGNICRRAGLYTKALSNYKKVDLEYNEIFPDRFAKYARENYNEIISRQIAVISGKVSLEDDKDSSGVTIKIYNGYEESETKSMQNGEYSLPLFASTPGTMFSLLAYKQGYNPNIINRKFDGTSKIAIRELQLKRLTNDNIGIITGVVFTIIGGGKRTPHHGIAGFMEGHKIEFHKFSEKRNEEEIYSALSNNNGIYTISLDPGTYQITSTFINARGIDKVFRLEKKVVKILNISAGAIKVD